MKKHRFLLVSLLFILGCLSTLFWPWMDTGLLVSVWSAFSAVVAGIVIIVLVFKRQPLRHLVLPLFALSLSLFLLVARTLDHQIRMGLVMLGTLLVIAAQLWLMSGGNGASGFRRKHE